jgi:ubiquinol-cytochrome c reductase cytochrome b subunit
LRMDWVEERLNLRAFFSWFLYRRVPRGVGWWYTMGSSALVVFILLVLTGLCLMLNYSPSPDHAYDSVQYTMDQVAFGSFIRSVHFWSASAMILLMVLHLLRAFFTASYRYPRELTWVVGVLLLVLVTGSAFTGYLLPWDQRAYWATNVGAGIAREVPLIGSWVQKALIGGTGIGTLTLSRFFTFHVGVLPPLIALLIGLHVFVVVKQGISSPPGLTAPGPRGGPSRAETYQDQYRASEQEGEHFFPEVIFRDSLVALLVFGVIVTLAIVRPATLEAPADPTSINYNPRPEWYFFFFFEFLKIFPGRLEPVGAVIIPLVVLVLLLALPFLDRGLDRRWSKRKAVVGAGGVAVVALISLEIAGGVSAPPRPASESNPLIREGQRVYREINCSYCHSIRGVGGAVGPDLTDIGARLSAQQLRQYLQSPGSMVPNTLHPKLQFSPEELNALVAYLGTLSAEVSYTQQAPDLFLKHCSGCHMIHGRGGTVGPDLSSVGSRRTLQFLHAFIGDPKAYSAGTVMPTFKDQLSDAQIRDLAAYLYGQKGSNK